MSSSLHTLQEMNVEIKTTQDDKAHMCQERLKQNRTNVESLKQVGNAHTSQKRLKARQNKLFDSFFSALNLSHHQSFQ